MKAKGYIYHIINTKTNKHYIGKTIDLQHRLECHFNNLENNQHHSHKLQRAYNLYGSDYFVVEAKEVEINDFEDLSLSEMKEIENFDSYLNGYNETLGGDGHKTSLTLSQSILVYNICQNYKGVNRQIARYFNCDHTVIDNISKNKIFANIVFDQQDYNDLVVKLNLQENNKIENYVPHNLQKMDKEKCLELLAVVTQTNCYEKTMCSIFNIDSKLSWRLKNGLIYKEFYEEYLQLSDEQKQHLFQSTLKKYNVKNIYAQRQRRSVKNALAQEQINYILDNKDIKSKAQIARDLKISADRVSAVCKGISYKDLISIYYSNKNCRE